MPQDDVIHDLILQILNNQRGQTTDLATLTQQGKTSEAFQSVQIAHNKDVSGKLDELREDSRLTKSRVTILEAQQVNNKSTADAQAVQIEDLSKRLANRESLRHLTEDELLHVREIMDTLTPEEMKTLDLILRTLTAPQMEILKTVLESRRTSIENSRVTQQKVREFLLQLALIGGGTVVFGDLWKHFFH